jgi:hypothetical protein
MEWLPLIIHRIHSALRPRVSLFGGTLVWLSSTHERQAPLGQVLANHDRTSVKCASATTT